MSKQDKIEADAPIHKGLYSALAAAQSEMGRAAKATANPHFKSKYADLASVCDACMPALSRHGIAVLQPAFDDESGRYVKTILIHGETGESVECRVPLIVQKNDMQGYGSAVTYARRYGLMGMAGIAPDDDDGNAAVKAAPKTEQTVTPDQFIKLRDAMEAADVDEAKLLSAYGATSLQQFPEAKLDAALKKLAATIAAKSPKENAYLEGDEIPQHEDV